MGRQTIDFDPDTASPMPMPGSWIAWVVPKGPLRRAWHWLLRQLGRPQPTLGFARVFEVDEGLRVLVVEAATDRIPPGAELYFSKRVDAKSALWGSP